MRHVHHRLPFKVRRNFGGYFFYCVVIIKQNLCASLQHFNRKIVFKSKNYILFCQDYMLKTIAFCRYCHHDRLPITVLVHILVFIRMIRFDKSELFQYSHYLGDTFNYLITYLYNIRQKRRGNKASKRRPAPQTHHDTKDAR